MKKTILVGLIALLIAPEALSAARIDKNEAYTLCKQRVIAEYGGGRVTLRKIKSLKEVWDIEVEAVTPFDGRQRTWCTINKDDHRILLSSLF